MIDEDVRHIIESELQTGEELLWAGKPQKIIFTIFEKIMIGFIIFWFVMVTLIILPSLLSGQETYEITINGNPTLVSFAEYLLFASIFPLFGFFMLGAVFGCAALRTRNFYALTNQRVLIVSTFLGRRVTSIMPNQFKKITRSGNEDVGRIDFFKPSGKEYMKIWRPFEFQSFSGIKNAKQVEHLIFSTFLKETHHE